MFCIHIHQWEVKFCDGVYFSDIVAVISFRAEFIIVLVLCYSFCGSVTIPDPVQSTQNVMTVYFSSDQAYTRRGFRAHYTAGIGCCYPWGKCTQDKVPVVIFVNFFPLRSVLKTKNFLQNVRVDLQIFNRRKPLSQK